MSLAFLTGCSSNSAPADPKSSTPPPSFSVTAIAPAAGATQVQTNATIQITFSSPAEATSVTATNIAVTNPKPVAGAITYNATTNTATFTPSAALAFGSTYTVTVAGVTSSTGTTMANSFTSTFTTMAAPPVPQFQASLFNDYGTIGGRISVDTSGNVTIQLTGAAANTTYTSDFCPAFVQYNGTSDAPPCLDTASVTTGANGNGASIMLFPKPGNWAGDFNLIASSNSVPLQSAAYSTGSFPASNSDPGGFPSGTVYMAPLLPASTTNGAGVATRSSPQDPLTSGTVTYSNGSMIFVVSGAAPNTNYSAVESQTVQLNSSGAYELSDFNTDAGGNASSTESLDDGAGGDMFQVMPPSDAGFIGGFSVPQ
ncbi:MAG: Ig-like domain-containing protein [Terracidiphilus sp.]